MPLLGLLNYIISAPSSEGLFVSETEFFVDLESSIISVPIDSLMFSMMLSNTALPASFLSGEFILVLL